MNAEERILSLTKQIERLGEELTQINKLRLYKMAEMIRDDVAEIRKEIEVIKRTIKSRS